MEGSCLYLCSEKQDARLPSNLSLELLHLQGQATADVQRTEIKFVHIGLKLVAFRGYPRSIEAVKQQGGLDKYCFFFAEH